MQFLKSLATCTLVGWLALLTIGLTYTPAEQPARVDIAPPAIHYETDLWTAYGKNVAAADADYTGKTLTINVVRGKVNKDAKGRYFIALDIPSPKPAWVTTPGFVCYVKADQIAKLRRAGNLDAFKLRGKCAGRDDDAAAWEGYQVTLNDCEVLDVLEYSQKQKGWISKP